jgi:hypothetical protein
MTTIIRSPMRISDDSVRNSDLYCRKFTNMPKEKQHSHRFDTNYEETTIKQEQWMRIKHFSKKYNCNQPQEIAVMDILNQRFCIVTYREYAKMRHRFNVNSPFVVIFKYFSSSEVCLLQETQNMR